MRTINLVLAVFLILSLEAYSNGLKWDTLDTKFERIYYHGNSCNETPDYLSAFSLGARIESDLEDSIFWLLKKDLSENSFHRIDKDNNPNEYQLNSGFLREDNVLYAVGDSGYIFQKHITHDKWTYSKKIENSIVLSNIVFRDINYGILSNGSTIDKNKEQIFYTEDSGETWNLLVNSFDDFDDRYIIRDLRIFEDTILVIIHDVSKQCLFMKVSFNLGKDWDDKRQIPIIFLTRINYQLKDSKLWIAGREKKQGKLGAKDIIIYTENFGESWNEQINDEYGYGYGVSSLVFLDDLSEGFAINRNGVFHTKDGTNWNYYHEPFYYEFQNLVLYNYENEIYLIRDSVALKYNRDGTSVNEEPLYSFSLHPNPASDYIEISFGSHSVNKGLQPLVHGGEFEIYDVLGNVVWKSTENTLTPALSLREREHKIDISHLPRGVYFVRIGERVEKFVKK